MPKVVVAGATIECSHGGKAQLPKGDNRLQISNKPVVTAGQIVGRYWPGDQCQRPVCDLEGIRCWAELIEYGSLSDHERIV